MNVLCVNAGLDFWLDALELLASEHGWQPVYICGTGAAEVRARELFPDAPYHDTARLNAAEPAPGCEALPLPALDAPLLDRLAPFETVYLRMLDRLDAHGELTTRKRVYLWHQQLRYWLAVLERYRPELIVSRTAPHMGYDWVLYALAEVLGLKFAHFERTAIPGRVYPVRSFAYGSPELGKLAASMSTDCEPSPPSAEALAHLERLRRDYAQAMPLHLAHKLKRFSGGDVPTPAGAALRAAKDAARGLAKGDLGYVRKTMARNLGSLTKRRLARVYGELARPLTEDDFAQPFVFAALQCEPERQTCPCGGQYGSQYLMVEALAAAVPQGWRVYVKEHLSQFKTYQKAERARSEEFYRHLAAIPNVRLVPLDVTSFALIDRARAAATVSGSVAWEAVCRGVPALLFGYGWYRDCPGVFPAGSTALLAEAIAQIAGGFRPDPAGVRGFLCALEQVAAQAYVDPIADAEKVLDRGANARALAACLAGFVAAGGADPVVKVAKECSRAS